MLVQWEKTHSGKLLPLKFYHLNEKIYTREHINEPREMEEEEGDRGTEKYRVKK